MNEYKKLDRGTSDHRERQVEGGEILLMPSKAVCCSYILPLILEEK